MSHRKRENELFEHYSKLVSGGKDGEDGEGSKNKRNKSTDESPIPEYLKGIYYLQQYKLTKINI